MMMMTPTVQEGSVVLGSERDSAGDLNKGREGEGKGERRERRERREESEEKREKRVEMGVGWESVAESSVFSNSSTASS